MALLGDGELLWRRVHAVQRNTDAAQTAQSCAFRTTDFCVHVASRTTMLDVLTRYPDAHLYEFSVAEAKNAGAMSVDDTRVAGEHEDHALVLPAEIVSKKGFAKSLVRRRVWPPSWWPPADADATQG